jgi:hypothetical protein
MCQYVRPITLFSNKFESYLNQKQANKFIPKRTVANYMANVAVKEKIIKESEDKYYAE